MVKIHNLQPKRIRLGTTPFIIHAKCHGLRARPNTRDRTRSYQWKVRVTRLGIATRSRTFTYWVGHGIEGCSEYFDFAQFARCIVDDATAYQDYPNRDQFIRYNCGVGVTFEEASHRYNACAATYSKLRHLSGRNSYEHFVNRMRLGRFSC